MGQKTHPYGFRLVYNKRWYSRWFASHDYAKTLEADLRLRRYLKSRLFRAGISEVDSRAASRCVRMVRRVVRPDATGRNVQPPQYRPTNLRYALARRAHSASDQPRFCAASAAEISWRRRSHSRRSSCF